MRTSSRHVRDDLPASELGPRQRDVRLDDLPGNTGRRSMPGRGQPSRLHVDELRPQPGRLVGRRELPRRRALLAARERHVQVRIAFGRPAERAHRVREAHEVGRGARSGGVVRRERQRDSGRHLAPSRHARPLGANAAARLGQPNACGLAGLPVSPEAARSYWPGKVVPIAALWGSAPVVTSTGSLMKSVPLPVSEGYAATAKLRGTIHWSLRVASFSALVR